MPQMSPMWWMTLMALFNSIVMMSISLMYFHYKNKWVNSFKTKMTKMTWKWL